MEHLFDLSLPSQRLLILWNPPFPPATDLCPLDLPSDTTCTILSSHIHTHNVSRLSQFVSVWKEKEGTEKGEIGWREVQKKKEKKRKNSIGVDVRV